MSNRLRLGVHPRLYIGREEIDRLRREPELPYLKEAARRVAREAQREVRLPELDYPRNVHNEHLLRARRMQARVLTLLVRWVQTGQERFRAAVVRCIGQMGQWRHWSWIAWRAGDARPDATFDLSYGENSATIALAWDWLYGTLSAEEEGLFLKVARHWSFRSGVRHCRPRAAWWFGRPDSNWNTVCAGGLGMLCLAMYEEAPEARRLLPLVEQSVAPFMKLLDRTDGAWPEGIGYWNYGMLYAFRYLLSHERATGRPHPLLALKGVRRTLSFPLDFCPHGQPCSFGDVNHWSPFPFHYAAAIRLGRGDVLRALDAHLERHGVPGGGRGEGAEWLAVHPGRPAPAGGPGRRPGRVTLYRGLDWGVIADRMPQPRLYVSVRGGTTDVPHGHRDLLSFHCVVGGERLITDLKPAEYLDTTFSPRREELFEITPASKNTILINGVGVASKSRLDRTERIRLPGAEGIRLEATSAMGAMHDGPAAQFCGRLVLLLDDRAFLIVDRAVLTRAGRVESRMHTYGDVTLARAGALVRGERQRLRVAYACTVRAVLRTALSAPTTPTAPATTILRWCTEASGELDVTMATLLSPGTGLARVSLEQAGRQLIIRAGGRGWERDLKLTAVLRPARQ